MDQSPVPAAVTIVQAWQKAANSQNVPQLLERSHPEILIAGPRGSGTGHQLLQDWLARAGLILETRRAFVRDNTVILDQHGTWHDAENNAVIGEADVASVFQVGDGVVTSLTRYDHLDTALKAANLQYADEIALPAD